MKRLKFKVIKRRDAIAQGLSRYFTGKPCKYGHVDERKVSDKGCRTCSRLKVQAWAKNNRARASESARKTHFRMYRNNWRYRLTSMLNRCYTGYSKGLVVTITVQDLLNQLAAQEQKDYYTGRPLSLGVNDPLTSPSLDRLDSAQGYVPGNVVITTWAVNRAKNELSYKQFLDLCSAITQNTPQRRN